MTSLLWAVTIGVSYAAGSVPFGYVLGKLHGVDVRAHGSGNVGATNVARVLGYPLGVLVFVLDAGKGVLAAGVLPGVIAGVDGGILPIICGAAAILGHVFPAYLGFKGGRGVATACGVLAFIMPLPTAIALGVWVTVALWTQYVSAASILAALSVPVGVLSLHHRELHLHVPGIVFSGLIALLVIARHIPNIRRLLAGTESRIGRRK
jgi:glycerol-3-phosphate acyltransferase PlsY